MLAPVISTLAKTAAPHRRLLSLAAAALIAVSLLTGAPSPARAVLILDNIIFIGPKGGAATFKIKNTSKQPEAYRLNWADLYMLPDGKKELVPQGQTVPGLMPAQSYMFMSPRRLMIMPDQLQNIRFMVRRTQDMPPGEYRSYIVLQPEEVPKEYSPETYQAAASGKGTAAVQMDLLSGYRIPVFFLNGDTTLSLTIPRAAYVAGGKDGAGVSFTMQREGNRSALGDLSVTCLSNGKPFSLGSGQIRIYTELTSRDYFFRLNPIPADCATASLDYMPHSMDPDYTGAAVTLAEIPLR